MELTLAPHEKLGLLILGIGFVTLLAIAIVIIWHDRHPT